MTTSLKERLHRQLVAARQTSEQLLSSFTTVEQWTKQVYPGANHALWFVGHMGVSDNFFVSILVPEKARELPDFGLKFGMGSHPVGDPGEYPDVPTVLGYMRERRQTLLEILDASDDESLREKLPPGTPDFLSDRGSVFETAVWHEGLHSGQLSVCRRSLGHTPLKP